MNWLTIARKEFSDASRSLMLWIVSALFILFALVVMGAYIIFQEEFTPPDAEPGTAVDVFLFVLSPVGLFAPIIALLVGYKAIVGERESGSLKVLLSLPYTRLDVMIGKFIGRSMVMAVPLLLAFIILGGLILAFVGTFSVLDYVVIIILSLLFAAVFVSIAIAISSMTKSSTIAGAAMFGVYLVFLVFWDLFELALLYLIEGTVFPPDPIPHWFLFVDMLAPQGAYSNAVQGFLPGVDIYGGMFPENPPLYLSEWAALLVLIAWFAIPFFLAYVRFRGVDL